MYSSSTGLILINSSNQYPFTSPPSFSFNENKQDHEIYNIHGYHNQDLNTAAAHLFPPEVTVPPASLQNNSLPKTKTKRPAAAHDNNIIIRKDKHRKIVTAQGARDRRVRLSIQVARKFFDLHDTLGYEKASETLDWLLTKSKPDIDEIVKNKHRRSSCTTTIDEGCSGSIYNYHKELQSGDKNYIKSSNIIVSEDLSRSSAASLLAREMRAKARARARERTQQKMLARHFFETNKLLFPDFRIAENHPSTNWNELSSHFKSSTVSEFCPKTNFQLGVRLYEADNKKYFMTRPK